MTHKQLVSHTKKIISKIPDNAVKNAYFKLIDRRDYTTLSIIAPIFLEVFVAKKEIIQFKELVTKLKEQ